VTEPITTAASLPITITGLTKTYGDTHALDHVDLHIRSGEFLTLLGPSGSGKTTLLMTIAGFTRPDSGSLKFGDTEVICTPPHKRDVGMVFQSYALFPHMDVAENIAFPLTLRHLPKDEIARRVNMALETVQLGGYGRRGIAQLSGGQRQRVALARAIVFEPRILLMDEPLSALDKKLREHMQIELRHLHDKLGMTTVYVTHDQREALTMSDRIAVVNQGRVMQLGDPETLYERPANKFVADFIGDSTFLPVEISGSQAVCHGRPLELPPDAPIRADSFLMLRPEKLRRLTGDEPLAGMNTFSGTIKHIVYQGDSVLTQVTLPDGQVVCMREASRPESPEAQAGGPVTLGLRREDTILVCDD
jgi:putative spermidine/putrescine transport system ATP-binding protein